MIDKRPTTPREVAAFSLFSMAEEAAWSDGALHHYLSRAGLDSRDAALASEYAWRFLRDAREHDLPAIGELETLRQIRERRRTMSNGYGLLRKRA